MPRKPKVVKSIWNWLAPTLGAGTNAAAWDSVTNGGAIPFTGDWDAFRVMNTALNAGAGAAMGHAIRNKNLIAATGEMTLNTAKDTAIMANRWLKDDTAIKREALSGNNVNALTRTLLLGGLGLGALGLGGYGLHKWLQKKDEEAKKKEKGHIKIRVKGKDGDPNKTMDVMLPVDNPELTPAMLEGLNMSLRRNAKEVIRANSLKKDPNTGKLIPYEEWKARYGNGQAGGMGLSKMSSWLPFYQDEPEPQSPPAEDPNAPVLLRRIVGPTITEYRLPSGATKSTLTPEVVAAILSGAPATQPQQLNESYEATGADTPQSFDDDDDDDFDKLAGQGPGPGGPPPGGPGGPVQGADVPPDRNQPAAGLPPGGNSNAVSAASARLADILTKIKQQRNIG